MKITLGTTYYNSPRELKLFMQNHIEYIDELIVVDDGSQIYPAIDHITPIPKLKLYRVKKDYGFNSHGCRNLIMKESENDWVILMDVDRRFTNTKQSIESIKSRKLKENTLYRFIAMTLEKDNTPKNLHFSVNDYLINKNHFFKAGGYDEEIVGFRTGDRQYFKQLKNFGKESVLYDVEMILLRKPTLLMENSIFLSPNDKKSRTPDEKELLKLIDKRIKNPDPNKPILTFEWERVF